MCVNTTYHSRIEMTPCEAVYGETGAVGLATTTLPSENIEVDNILSLDDIDAMYAGEFCTTP